jgi:transcriptional regulator with PAS, ATPase and Fis domain
MNFDGQKIENYWNRYVAGFEEIPDHLEGLDDAILASWKRSKSMANPFETKPVPMTAAEYEQLMSENKQLIEISLPYMIKFYEVAKSATQNVLLTDANGRQLKNVGSDNKGLVDLMSRISVINGIDYSEKICGTSSVSMSLHEDKPFLLRGAEHYRKIYHDLACFSAPIHSISNKQIGCICITGRMENYQPFVMSALIMMIQAIENELRLRQTNDLLRHVVSNMKQVFLLLKDNGEILDHNGQANQILEICTNLNGHHLDDFFEMPAPLSVHQESRPLTLLKPNKTKIHLSAQVLPIEDANNEPLFLLLFNSLSDIQKEASLQMGYTAAYQFSDILGSSASMKKVKELGLLASGNSSSVLIEGQSGTGKEMLSQAIHNESKRKEAPFVSVHCGSIPKELMEAELFGNEKAYQMGKLEIASTGTIFLDEIQHLSLECQHKLYDFLANKKSGSKILDVRLIASSSTPLVSQVASGQFLRDLYDTLNELPIQIEPLKNRREDIQPLIEYYIGRYNRILKKNVKGIEKDSLKLLIGYNWPGNIRQLESVIEQMVHASKSAYLRLLICRTI